MRELLSGGCKWVSYVDTKGAGRVGWSHLVLLASLLLLLLLLLSCPCFAI